MNRILLTGSTGYLGGRIADYLLNVKGYELISERIELTQAVSEDSLKGANKVVHLAAPNEIESLHNPYGAIQSTVAGTLRLLEAAKKSGVERFIYLSTAHVYGAPLRGNISEDMPTRPVHPYAITHRAAEDFVFSFEKEMQVSVLRLSNSCGSPIDPRVNRWTLLVNDLCRQAVEKGSILLNSAGKQRRDFIAIKDVCRAVEHIFSLDKERNENGLFNLGGDCSLRIIDVAELISERAKKILDIEARIEINNPEVGNIEESLNYDCTKLFKTGFKLESNITEAIDETLIFCREHFGKKRG